MKNLTTNGFANYKVPDLLAKAAYILASMQAHPEYFSKPTPTYEVVQTAITELSIAETNAASGDRMKISERDTRKAELVNLLQQMGTFVNFVANGSREIAEKSGFELVKPKTKRILEPITIGPKLLRTDTPGSIDASIIAQRGISRGTTWYQTSNPQLPLGQWTAYANQTNKFTFENLTAGVPQYVCVEMNGPRKQKQLSPVSTLIP